jgi:hypothetical protein
MSEIGDVSVETVELAAPKSREVLVDMRASGVCHTDYHFYTGDYDVPLPVVLGHEGPVSSKGSERESRRSRPATTSFSRCSRRVINVSTATAGALISVSLHSTFGLRERYWMGRNACVRTVTT